MAVPHILVAATEIEAAPLNENFAYLLAKIEATEALAAGYLKLLTGGAYGALTARTATTEYEPSATRPTLVTLIVSTEGNSSMTALVGGVEVGGCGSSATVSTIQTMTFLVQPAKKWKYTAANIKEVRSSYLTL